MHYSNMNDSARFCMILRYQLLSFNIYITITVCVNLLITDRMVLITAGVGSIDNRAGLAHLIRTDVDLYIKADLIILIRYDISLLFELTFPERLKLI